MQFFWGSDATLGHWLAMTIAPVEQWQFDTTRVGRRVHVYEELASTNTLAAELPVRVPDELDGMIVLARHQTAGRGRFGRTWRSRPGSSVLMSVVLVLPPDLRRPSILTAWAAVAVGEAVRELAGVQAQIKWPNDLLIRGKKVCGILIEQGVGAGAANQPLFRTVVGIGLNLNQTAAEFAAAGLPDATSLGTEAGVEFDLRSAADALVRHLDAEYCRLLDGERVAVETDWKWRTGLLGRQVIIELTDGTRIAGRMREMGFAGLEVEASDGQVRVIVPEAVEHVRAE